MEEIEIVTLKPDKWQLYRDLRLQALKEAPYAFASTYEENAKHPGEFWMKRLEDAAAGNTQWLVFAKLDGKIIGMAGAFAEKEIDNAHVIAVYVAPAARGRGVSKMLMNDLLIRIKSNKLVKKITVDVNPEQQAAYNLYKNSGFREIKQYRMVLGDGKEHEIRQLQMN